MVISVMVVIILITSAFLLIGPSAGPEKKALWGVELQGTIAKKVRSNSDGSMFVWMVDNVLPDVVHRSDIYGIAQNGTINWHRTYYNVQTVTYGGPSLMIVGGSNNQSNQDNFIFGFDQFNRTKLAIHCGNLTPTSLAPSIDNGVFAVGYRFDQYDAELGQAGEHWLKRYLPNGTVGWERTGSDRTLKYAPNGTLVLWDQKGVAGLDQNNGNTTWGYTFGEMDMITLVTDDAFYGSRHNGSLECMDINGTVRWKLDLGSDNFRISVIAIDASERSYCYVMPVGRQTPRDQLLVVDPYGNVISNKTVMVDKATGLRDGALTIYRDTMESLDRSGTTLWTYHIPVPWNASIWYNDGLGKIILVSPDKTDAVTIESIVTTSILSCFINN